LTTKPIVIVLSAGRGERFRAAGGITHKLDALLAGKPVLQHTLDAVAATGLALHIVRPAPELLTMGDSIAAGVAATPDAGGWLLLPADVPMLEASTIDRIAQAIEQGAEAARPVHAGQVGHPVGFAASKRAELLNCKGFPGASVVFSASVAIKIEVNDIGCVSDVDTPSALAHIEACLEERSNLRAVV
jgi:molybdenum cofactor cytidylyltransferase